MHIEILSTPGLGDRTYVVHASGRAIVIDPQRDIDRVETLLASRDLQLVLVAETHIHNDYVTGGLALARRSGARYVVSADEPVTFERQAVRGGDELAAGPLHVRAIDTPGHTPHHLSYMVRDVSDGDQPAALFTGGSLLFGSVGRTDLIAPDQTLPLTQAQYRSARHLIELLPEETGVFPTHGFGSFCSAGSVAAVTASTIGAEKIRNDVMTAKDEQDFAAALLANLTAYPSYYAHMGPLNLAGPDLPDPSEPRTFGPDELARRIEDGEWIVDLRNRVAFAADHVGGSVSIELGDQFATYLGWLVPWGAPVTLLGPDREQIAAARRELVRIGIDHLAGAATGPLDQIAAGLPRRSYPRVDFPHVPLVLPKGEILLDVRRTDERQRGCIDDSVHIPLTDLPQRLGELPTARIWVHCGSGFRAGIAASLLDRAHRTVVHIDDAFANAGRRGLALNRPNPEEEL